jgi:hypothetical protein
MGETRENPVRIPFPIPAGNVCRATFRVRYFFGFRKFLPKNSIATNVPISRAASNA